MLAQPRGRLVTIPTFDPTFDLGTWMGEWQRSSGMGHLWRFGAVGLGVVALAACTTDAQPDGESSDDPTAADATSGGEPAGSDAGADGGDGSGSDAGDDGAAPPADGTVTYHRDIRPMLQTRCVGCHSPGNIAPFPLTTFDEVHPLREAIVAAVGSRSMPPWMPADGCTEYFEDPSVSGQEYAQLQTWVAEGGPVGDPADYVAPPPAPTGELSRVDVTLPFPEAYTPVGEPDDYHCFVLDWPQTETSYITGFHAVPGNLTQVHHVIAYAATADEAGTYTDLDDAEAGPGYTCFGGPGGTAASFGARWLGGWAPGGRGSDFPEGIGLRMEPGSKVILQVYYNTLTSDPSPDLTQIQFKVDATVEREAFMMPWADPDWLTGGMPIPAGAEAATFEWSLDPTFVMSFLTDAISAFTAFDIYSVSHHMHKRGHRGQAEIVRADGTRECLVQIPDYDFNWQSRYRFVEPKRFNPGDDLRIACEFDNSAGDTAVNWGDGTDDEMCVGIFLIAEAD